MKRSLFAMFLATTLNTVACDEKTEDKKASPPTTQAAEPAKAVEPAKAAEPAKAESPAPAPTAEAPAK